MSTPPGGFGPPSYGYGGYYGGPSSEKNNLGVWALVLGILGLCCGPIGIGGIVLGNLSQKAAAAGLATNGSIGRAGFILGVIAVALWIVGLIGVGTGMIDSPAGI